MNLDRVFPYLVPALPDPSWEAVCVHVGHGVWARLFEDAAGPAGLVHTPVTPEQLSSAGVTAAEAHARAVANLDHFAETTPEMTIETVGEPGDAVQLYLYGEHPRSAACLRLPDLYEEACERLQTDRVCAVVPEWESLVMFPARDIAYRERIVAALRAADPNPTRPVGFGVFELTPAGVREFRE